MRWTIRTFSIRPRAMVSSSSGVAATALKSFSFSLDEAGACMKAGLVMSSTTNCHGSSSGKSGVSPRINFAHSSAISGRSAPPARCMAIAPNWTRKACHA